MQGKGLFSYVVMHAFSIGQLVEQRQAGMQQATKKTIEIIGLSKFWMKPNTGAPSFCMTCVVQKFAVNINATCIYMACLYSSFALLQQFCCYGLH